MWWSTRAKVWSCLPGRNRSCLAPRVDHLAWPSDCYHACSFCNSDRQRSPFPSVVAVFAKAHSRGDDFVASLVLWAGNHASNGVLGSVSRHDRIFARRRHHGLSGSSNSTLGREVWPARRALLELLVFHSRSASCVDPSWPTLLTTSPQSRAA